MKIKINGNGNLEIERAGKMKEQGCCNLIGISCGDWCALFCEPNIDKNNDMVLLSICKTSFACKARDFTDERK